MSLEFMLIVIFILFSTVGLFVKAVKTDAGKKTAIHLLSRWLR